MLRFVSWILVVVFLLILFGRGGITIFMLPLVLSLYLIFRRYDYAGHGVLIAVVISVLLSRDGVGWGLGLGVFPLLETIAVLMLLGLLGGGVIDYLNSRRKNT